MTYYIAKRYGLCAGVLYENIRYHLHGETHFWVKVSPTTMSRLIPWSKDTIRDTLDRLVAAGVIVEDHATAGYYHLNTALPNIHTREVDWLEDSENTVENPVSTDGESGDNTLYNP